MIIIIRRLTIALLAVAIYPNNLSAFHFYNLSCNKDPFGYMNMVKAVKKVQRRIVAAGRGRVIQSPAVKSEILRLAGNKRSPHVVYLGTASYEKETAYDLQAAGFKDSGCTVSHVKLTEMDEAKRNKKEIAADLEKADIIAVSGGNTLFAMTRWRKLGVDKLLNKALDRGAVLCGGSAGAICWFDGGHSDSRDPTSVRYPKPNLTEEEKKNWKYICVKGLGYISGLCCPHHDSTQSNGVKRSDDFDGMLAKHAGDQGVCIDDQAALIVDGDMFRVVVTDVASATTAVRSRRVVVDHSVEGGSRIVNNVFLPTKDFLPLSMLNVH